MFVCWIDLQLEAKRKWNVAIINHSLEFRAIPIDSCDPILPSISISRGDLFAIVAESPPENIAEQHIGHLIYGFKTQ